MRLLQDSSGAAPEFVQLVLSLAPSFGIDSSELLRSANLKSKTQLCSRVPLCAARQLWLEAAQMSGDPLFGFHAAERAPFGGLGLLDYLTANSRTWREAAERLVTFSPLLVDAGEFSLEIIGDRVHLQHRVVGGIGVLAELCWSLVWLRSRQYSGEPIVPLEMRFAHALHGQRDAYADLFACPVSGNAAYDEIIFDRQVLDLPFRGAEPRLAEILHAHAADRLNAFRADVPILPFVSEVRFALRACLAQGDARLQRVAERLGISERSLQRHLSQANTSHRALLDELRQELVEGYRGRPATVSRSKMADVLGYSSARSLARAAGRWQSPP